jgi:hypothetical protein
MTSLNAHRTETDRLLARTTEAIQGDASYFNGPARSEHRHATDTRTMVAGIAAVAHNYVINIRLVDPIAIGQGVEHLSQYLLGMDVM